MEKKILASLKAHASGLAAAAMVFLACYEDGSLSGNDWQLIATAALAAFGVTYAVPNKK